MGDRERKLYKSQSFIHHSNLDVVNNVSQDTIGFLSRHLDKNIETEKKYKLKQITEDQLPKTIFEMPHIKKFLLNREEDKKESLMESQKIVNCFPYQGEKELLDLRIKLLYDSVDLFVITEGDYTYSGISKAYTCQQTLDELGIPKDKIKVVEVKFPELPEGITAKGREEFLRDSARDHIPLNSFCYVTDTNEIPNPLFFDYYTGIMSNNTAPILRVPMVHLSGRADLKLVGVAGEEKQWDRAYLCATEHVKQHKLTAMRNPRYAGVFHIYLNDNGRVEDAGWKLEWMGNKEHKKDEYRASVDYSTHSTLGCKLRLEFLDDYQPSAGTVNPMSQTDILLENYDKNLLPSLLLNTPKFYEFFLPALDVSDKKQEALKFGPENLSFLKFNPSPMNSVYIVDNFYADPYAVREFAMNQEYEPDGEGKGYTGRRTYKQFFPPGMKERFEEIIGEKIGNWEGHGFNGRFQYNVGGDKLVYHCDEQKWAGLIYLTPNAPYQAGTRLLGHKKTRVRFNKDPRIMECFNQESFLDGTPFETVDHVGNVFNRLVIYRGGLIHSASEYFGWNKENARLWHMFFFD
jgi:hypothetical protein